MKTTSEMKHTPGPWTHQDTAGSHQFAVYAEATGNDVALVFNRSNKSENDARLIASAPDLLAALEFCERVMGRVKSGQSGKDALTEAQQAARQAIARARGTP